MRPLSGAERRFPASDGSAASRVSGGAHRKAAAASLAGAGLARLPRLRLTLEAPGAAPAEQPRRDPAPSRLSYRLHRFWLTPSYRRMVRLGLPLALVAALAGGWLADPDNRLAMAQRYAALKSDFQNRPEFMISLLQVDGASPAVDRAIRGLLGQPFPVSSFSLDLEALRASIARIDAVAAVDLRVRSGGVLAVAVTERVPAAIWQTAAGLELVDASGHRVATLLGRAARPDLPLVAGEGAGAHVDEALRIFGAAGPVGMRVRGLVRMAERRWDLVLDRGQRILLPEFGAVAAMQRVMALNKADDMLSRDISVVDMRNDERPTLRLSGGAMSALLAARPRGATQMVGQ